MADWDLCPETFSKATDSRVGQLRNIDTLLLDSIDQVLCDLLGKRVRDAIYAHLTDTYSLETQNIPKNLQKFSRALEDVFGKSGKTVGYAICRKLFEKLEWTFIEVEGFDFLDYVEGAKVKLAQQSATRNFNILNNENSEDSGMLV